jgi:hypothetical protein
MAKSTFRVGGGYTAFVYNGQPLIYAQAIQETAPQPVNTPQPIQPLDSPYPIEIAIPIALQAGMLQITFLEQWNAEVWSQLGNNFATASDLLDVFKAQLAQGEIQCVKIINKPDGTQRKIVYQGCIVYNVQIDELIQINTMTIPKTITIMYRSRKELLS